MVASYIVLFNFVSASRLTKTPQTIHISTPAHNGLYDITRQVETIVSESGVQTGMVNVYVQGATAGIMV